MSVPEGGNVAGDEEEEIFACGDGGSEDDRKFDRLIGVIEDFMCGMDVASYFAGLPPHREVINDHDRHAYHKKCIAEVEAQLDARVARDFPEVHLGEIERIVRDRVAEVSEEVWEFVKHGFMDFVSFEALWKANNP